MMDRGIAYEAECAVIAAVIAFGPEAYDAAAQHLTKSSFGDSLNSVLWSACEKLILSGQRVDVVVLMDELKNHEIDWAAVVALEQSAIGIRSTAKHAQIVASHAKARALAFAARQVTDIASDESSSVESRVSKSIATLESVIDDRINDEARLIEEYSVEFLDHLEELADGKSAAGRSTGIFKLDEMMSGGFRDGQLVIIAARPSVGKSSFAQQLALTHSGSGIVSAFLGMEMTSKELTNRVVANLGRVSLGSLKTGRLSTDEWPRVTEGVEKLRGLPFYLKDKSAMTLSEVSAEARILVRRHGLKTLVIDYLQLMRGSNDRSDRRTQLEEITRGLKQLAKQLEITIILLSQLNRMVEQRTNPRPMLSDLKECGAIEEDADIVVALWTNNKSEDDSGDTKGCIVLKNRDGQTGEVALHFAGKYQQWTESFDSLDAPKKAAASVSNKYSKEF